MGKLQWFFIMNIAGFTAQIYTQPGTDLSIEIAYMFPEDVAIFRQKG